jgi:hypothetical protein
VGHTQAPGPKTDELRLRDERNAEMKGARCFGYYRVTIEL